MVYIPPLKKVRYLKRNLKKLFELSSVIEKRYMERYDLNLEELYPSSPRAFLKYIPLAWWTDIYTTIMKKRGKASKIKQIYYVDLLAGSGITYIKEHKRLIAGSALVANYFNRHPYDKIYLSEKNPNRCKVLRRSIELIKEIKWPELDCYIPCIGAEKLINGIDKQLKNEKHYHMFVFIDCEGPADIDWEDLGRLFKHPGDIMINFQIKGVIRNRNKITFLRRVYGSDFEIETGMDEDYYLKKYIERLRKTGREYVYPIKINDRITSRFKRKGGGRYYYYLILAVRKTLSGSPWFNAWLKLREWIETFDAEITDLEMEIYKGEQKRLNSYIK